MSVRNQISKLSFLKLAASIGFIMTSLTNKGIAGAVEDRQIEDIKKGLFALRQSKTDPITCATIFRDIQRIDSIAGKKYFNDKELAYFTKECQGYKPSPNPATSTQPAQKADPKASNPASSHVPMPKAAEGSDAQTKVTSALHTLAEGKADKSNCAKRVKLIETFDRLAEVEEKPSYSMSERNYFLKACFSILPEAAPLTHKTPKPKVPDAFLGELKVRVQLHQQKSQDSKEARDDLDKLLEELAQDKGNS